ncbi:hypothetical protein AN958_08751 [Leucoagaricus sp. SymC.cos]|nr:hypothetical protein AN958_08751 [Leucoagaricus sp. SymC.cos]
MGSVPRLEIIAKFKSSWISFLDSLILEWQTLNIVSTLLLSTLLTLLQVDGAGNDPLTRSIALTALICGLWSLEARKGADRILWNAWVLFALPAVWLAWALLLFAASVLSLIWRVSLIKPSPGNDKSISSLSSRSALAARVVMTVIFVLGVVYLALVVATLRRYGSKLDHKWAVRVDEWAKSGAKELTPDTVHLKPKYAHAIPFQPSGREEEDSYHSRNRMSIIDPQDLSSSRNRSSAEPGEMTQRDPPYSPRTHLARPNSASPTSPCTGDHHSTDRLGSSNTTSQVESLTNLLLAPVTTLEMTSSAVTNAVPLGAVDPLKSSDSLPNTTSENVQEYNGDEHFAYRRSWRVRKDDVSDISTDISSLSSWKIGVSGAFDWHSGALTDDQSLHSCSTNRHESRDPEIGSVSDAQGFWTPLAIQEWVKNVRGDDDVGDSELVEEKTRRCEQAPNIAIPTYYPAPLPLAYHPHAFLAYWHFLRLWGNAYNATLGVPQYPPQLMNFGFNAPSYPVSGHSIGYLGSATNGEQFCQTRTEQE